MSSEREMVEWSKQKNQQSIMEKESKIVSDGVIAELHKRDEEVIKDKNQQAQILLENQTLIIKQLLDHSI